MFIASNDRNYFVPCDFKEKYTEKSYHQEEKKRTNVNYTLLENPSSFVQPQGKVKMWTNAYYRAQGYLLKNSLCMVKTFDPCIDPT